MNKFLKLFAINSKTNISSYGANYRKNGKIPGYLIYGSLYLIVLGYGFFMAYSIGNSLSDFGMQKMLIFFAVILSIIICLLNSITTAFGYLFKTKDYEILSSLPIKTSTIFLSKLSGFLVMQYLFISVAYIPFMIIYFVFSPFSIVAIIYSLFGFIFIPLIPAFIGILIGILINMISTKIRWKTIFNILFLLIFIVGIMYLSMDIVSIINGIVNSSESILSTTNSIYYPLTLLLESIITESFTAFLAFVGINLAPIAILTIVCSIYYKNLNSFFMKSLKSRSYSYEKISQNTPLISATKKELKRLFSSPMYFINSCIGPILILILSVVTFFSDSILIAISMAGGAFSFNFLLFSTFMILISSPLAITISLEGKAFWIYKSLPIKPSLIFTAKIIMTQIIFLPLTLISIILIGISSSIPPLEIILMFLFGISVCLFSSALGLTIGLKKYNLNYTNEMQVIKQSSSVLIAMLLGMLILGCMVLFYIYVPIAGIFVILIWMFLFIVTTCVMLYFMFKNYDQKKMNEIV